MTAYLLDTNVVSEMTKTRPDAAAAAWLRVPRECFLSVVTIGELENGVHRLREREPQRADAIGVWVSRLREEYADRILDIDLAVVDGWARLPTRRTLPVLDSLLAATAVAHGLTVATRNVSDFVGTGVATVDPFAGPTG